MTNTMKNGQTYIMHGNDITLNKMCTINKETYSLTLDRERYLRYFNGEDLVQNIFYDLSIPEREFIISGWTPAEWDNMFNGIEE